LATNLIGHGHDTVNVGLAGSAQGIAGALNVSNPPSFTTLTVDNSADTVGHVVTITNASVSGLAPGVIGYTQADLAALNIKGGTGGSTYNVQSTPSHSAANSVVTSVTGRGFDTVNVGLAGSVQGVRGTLVLTNPPAFNTVTVDDSTDPTGRSVTFDTVTPLGDTLYGTIAGLAPGTIKYRAADTASPVHVLGGTGGNTFTVNATTVRTINLDTGTGTNTVTVRATTGALNITTGLALDTVNVGSTANTLDAIVGAVTVTGHGGNTTLNIHDDGTTVSQDYSVYADSVRRFDVTTLAPNMAAIGYSGISHLALYQGSAQAVINLGAIRNVLVVWSTAQGTTTDIYGGPGANYDEVRPYDADPGTPTDNRGIQGDVHFHGNNRYDILGYYDYLHPAGQQTYTLSATATGGQIVDGGFATVTYDSKVVAAGLLTSRQGSNTVNVLSTTASAYYGTQIQASSGDHVIVGMPVTGGRTLAGINGFLSIFSVDGNPNVVPAEVVIDDSGDTTAHPAVVINGAGASPAPDVVGLAPATISWLSLPPATPVTIRGGSGGNNFRVNSTAGSPLTIVAGTGIDTVDVGSDPVNLPLSTLNAIQGAVTVTGSGGNTTLNFNDKGGTPGTAPNQVYNYSLAQDSFSRTGTATVTYGGIASVNLDGANAGGSGFNALAVTSTAPGTTYNVNAGTGLNEFLVLDINYTLNGIQGPLNLHGTGGTLPDDDLAAIYDVDKTTQHTISVNASTTSQSGVVQRFADQAMLHPDAAPISYDGLNAYATVYTGGSAGHTINVQSNAADLFTIIGVGASDTVNVGNTSHTMAGISGDLRIQGTTPTVHLDDSGDTSGRTIDLAFDSPGSGYRISGLLPQSSFGGGRLFLVLDPAAPVTLQTGNVASTPTNDVFRVHDFTNAPAITINAGNGTNTLDYSAYTGDVTVNLRLGKATGLAVISDIQNVTGSIGNDLLVGDALANVLIGGTGRNILIGGGGLDRLVGGGGDNLLIGGGTVYDQDASALALLLAEWLQPSDFATRQNAIAMDLDLLAGTGIHLDGTTLLPDGLANILTPGPGNNWIIP
jgi:hypothetical protein